MGPAAVFDPNPTPLAPQAYFHENADQQIKKSSFVGDRRTGEAVEGAAMLGEVVRMDDYRILLESGPTPVYAVRRMTYMEGMADELGGDEEEEEEEEEGEDEDGVKKEKAVKPEDPLLTPAEVERILTLRRRGVRSDHADANTVINWTKAQTTQNNPPASAKKEDPKAATLLSMASCLHGKYCSIVVGPKIFFLFDKPTSKNSVQERVITSLDTERGVFNRYVIDDPRVPEGTEEDTGFGMPIGTALDGSHMYVLGGAPTEQQQMLRIDPVTMAVTNLSYAGDESFPACEYAEAIIGYVDTKLMVLAGDLTGGWNNARVIDIATITDAEPAPPAEEHADGEEAAPAGANPHGKWETVPLDADAPGPCGPGERRGVFLGHELWVVTATVDSLEVHVLDTDKNYWFKAPVTGTPPPRMTYFELEIVGRQVQLIGGRLSESCTPAFRGPGLEYESGNDYLYSLNTDRCEWVERHCHGVIPKYPTRATVTATETDLWAVIPTVDELTWWLAGQTTKPANHPEDPSVKSTKFGAVQFTYMLPRVVYPPEDPHDLSERTWMPTAAPTKWDQLEDRDYLNRTVWPVLMRGMTLLEKERPNRPVKALAEFLLLHNKGLPQ